MSKKDLIFYTEVRLAKRGTLKQRSFHGQERFVASGGVTASGKRSPVMPRNNGMSFRVNLGKFTSGKGRGQLLTSI